MTAMLSERPLTTDPATVAAAVIDELHRHVEPERATAEVRRDGRRTQVVLMLSPTIEDTTANALAVRAAAVVRTLDRSSPVVDVAVTRR